MATQELGLDLLLTLLPRLGPTHHHLHDDWADDVMAVLMTILIPMLLVRRVEMGMETPSSRDIIHHLRDPLSWRCPLVAAAEEKAAGELRRRSWPLPRAALALTLRILGSLPWPPAERGALDQRLAEVMVDLMMSLMVQYPRAAQLQAHAETYNPILDNRPAAMAYRKRNCAALESSPRGQGESE